MCSSKIFFLREPGQRDTGEVDECLRVLRTLPRDDFRSDVLGRAAKRERATRDVFAEPKVRELSVPVDVEQYVLGLNVPVHQVQLVQVLDGQQHLGQVEPGLVLVHRPVPLHVHEQVAAAHERHDEVQKTVVLVEVFQADDVPEVNRLHDPFFVVYPLHLRGFHGGCILINLCVTGAGEKKPKVVIIEKNVSKI